MKIKRIIGGNLESNGYVIMDEGTKSGYVIDPGYTPEKFLQVLKEWDMQLLGILLTHHHYDHTGGVDKIRQATSCKLYIHREDAGGLKMEADVLLEDGMQLRFGSEVIDVLHTPGHTKGGACYWIKRHRMVFTGDEIFNVDLGRTDLPGGSEADMRRSCRYIFNKWENDVEIHPGHGDPATMKYVRTHNREFLDML